MILKSDLLKKARLEEICNIQHERVSVMMNKIRVRWQNLVTTCIDSFVCRNTRERWDPMRSLSKSSTSRILPTTETSSNPRRCRSCQKRWNLQIKNLWKASSSWTTWTTTWRWSLRRIQCSLPLMRPMGAKWREVSPQSRWTVTRVTTRKPREVRRLRRKKLGRQSVACPIKPPRFWSCTIPPGSQWCPGLSSPSPGSSRHRRPASRISSSRFPRKFISSLTCRETPPPSDTPGTDTH